MLWFKLFTGVPMGLMKSIYKTLPRYYVQVKLGIHLAKEIARHFDSVSINYQITLDEDEIDSYKGMVDSMEDVTRFGTKKTIDNHLVQYTVG